MRVIGLTVATTWPDLRGSLSRWHFRSLGLPARAVGSPMAIAEWLIGRIHRWCAGSDGRLAVIRTHADLERCLAEGRPVGVLIGIQGGQVLEGSLDTIARLREHGVRMFAPAHVMDNAIVGSSTGRSATGLTAFGRETLAALEEQSIIVDLAHMSLPGVEQALKASTRPLTMSHTGLRDIAHEPSRWRRYSAANRNVPATVIQEIAKQGGMVGIALSTQLLGGSTLEAAARTVSLAIQSAGEAAVALGSDMDGALRTVVDVQGLPALAGTLLDTGLPTSTVAGVMGQNAVTWLKAALPKA